MEKMVDFHDALMTNVIVEQSLFETKANVIIDNSGWYGIVELCFEGVQEIKLCPAKENYSNEIYVSTLKQEDGLIFWADTIIETEDDCQKCSYIKALNLKWKKLA